MCAGQTGPAYASRFAVLTSARVHADHQPGTGTCVESGEGAVTQLRITKVGKDPSNDSIRTYAVAATQWKPE